MKLLKARVNNLESNLHIEIDMERIEDRSKALSYIGIEIAEALKYIPAPAVELAEEAETSQLISQDIAENNIPGLVEEPAHESKVAQEIATAETEEIASEAEESVVAEEAAKAQDNQPEEVQNAEYIEETRFEIKPSIWQRIKNSKFVRTISYILKIRVVLDYPALPEGNIENR